MKLRRMFVVVAFTASACASVTEEAVTPAPAPTTVPATTSTVPAECEVPNRSRTDVDSSGNRFSATTVDMSLDPLIIDLPGVPAWVLSDDLGRWVVWMQDGQQLTFDSAGELIATVTQAVAGTPPFEIDAAEGIVSAYRDHTWFTDPLPDTRVVHFGRYSAALTGPTDRYAHGVLGDAIEAEGFEVIDRCAGTTVTSLTLSDPDVIEGISPMLADLDADGEPEVIVTISNSETGARIAAYGLDGRLIAETDPVGRGNRWRNQMAVVPIGPGGATELIDVQTPHIGGIVQFFALDGDRLVRRAGIEPFTSHVIGSSNLDLGIVVDATGDGQANVVVPTQDRRKLAIIRRTNDGVSVTTAVNLNARAATNIAVGDRSLAVGTESSLMVWAAR